MGMALTLRRALKQIAPPIIVQLLRPRRNPVPYSGIFSSFDEVKYPAGVNFISSAGLEWTRQKLRAAQANRDWRRGAGGLQPGDVFLLSLLSLTMELGRRAEVYDIGGGLGQTYFSLRPPDA